MHKTVFETPFLAGFLQRVSHWLLTAFGWRLEGQVPDLPKMVVIAAPHTSNWDFPLMLAAVFALRSKVRWMAKSSAFPWPFHGIMRWLGGIPIDRSQATGVVARAVQSFGDREQLLLVIPPEGTRSRVRHWKTGFYHIACGAGVPLLMTYMDYGRKAVGVGPLMRPTGDIDADMEVIRDFYSTIQGKHHERWDGATVMTREASDRA
ncbi:MAG: lysophospholipid acyltransferase family protein [Anaerolineae bacterium]